MLHYDGILYLKVPKALMLRHDYPALAPPGKADPA